MRKRTDAVRRFLVAAVAMVLTAGPCFGQPSPATTVYERPGAGGGAPITRSQVAWRLLARGRDYDALRHFSRMARLRPAEGEPKIGYALAVAGLGDLRRGARAMRRALRIDPESLLNLTIDGRLRSRIHALTAGYHTRLENNQADRDAAFMLAVLYGLIGDTESARYAMGLLESGGDQTPSAMDLRRLIAAPAEPTTQTALPAAAVEPAGEPETPPDDATETDSSGPGTAAGTAAPPALPQRIRIDYDKLRQDLREVAGALDRFTQKFIRAVGESESR